MVHCYTVLDMTWSVNRPQKMLEPWKKGIDYKEKLPWNFVWIHTLTSVSVGIYGHCRI